VVDARHFPLSVVVILNRLSLHLCPQSLVPNITTSPNDRDRSALKLGAN
jgi:hypothetical protein